MITDITLEYLQSMLRQAKVSARNNSDAEALDVKNLYEDWEMIQNGTELVVGTYLNYNTNLYKVLQTHNKQSTWDPEDAPSLFAKVLIPDPEVIPDWEQPSSTNPYMKGDKVKHIGYIWQSLVDNNVWEPSDAVPTLWENKGAV